MASEGLTALSRRTLGMHERASRRSLFNVGSAKPHPPAVHNDRQRAGPRTLSDSLRADPHH